MKDLTLDEVLPAQVTSYAECLGIALISIDGELNRVGAVVGGKLWFDTLHGWLNLTAFVGAEPHGRSRRRRVWLRVPRNSPQHERSTQKIKDLIDWAYTANIHAQKRADARAERRLRRANRAKR